MEKKKLLLVAVSVGLFLVIVVGASILVFSPRDYPSAVKANEIAIAPGVTAVNSPGNKTAPEGTATAQSVVEPPAITINTPTNTEAPASGVQTETERKLENVIYIQGAGASDAVQSVRLNDGNTRTYITIPSTQENYVTNANTIAANAGTQTGSAVNTRGTTQNVTAVPVQNVPVAAPVQNTTAAKSVKTQPSKTVKTESNYWVQAGSFSKKANADSTKDILAQNGLKSVVMNGDINGKTYYRVRVGPYISRNEAEYWLRLIKEIDGMGSSQVWVSPANKSI